MNRCAYELAAAAYVKYSASKMHEGDIERKSPLQVLDPRDPVSKKQLKASIADTIVWEVAGSSRDEIVGRVEQEYERLLAQSVVFTHIPALTAGRVRGAERELVRRRAANPAFGAAKGAT